MACSDYPRVLICMLTRVNADDTLNNNLLLRSLFADWPKDRIAQIYSGGSNGDRGFCGQDYCLSAEDRRMGSLFFKLKEKYLQEQNAGSPVSQISQRQPKRPSILRKLAGQPGRFVMNSGLYELLFRLRPSEALLSWLKNYCPDVIFAQGYNLTFAWLPVLLKERFKVPLTFFTSDDWPSYLYSHTDGLKSITSSHMRRLVVRSTKELLASTDVPLAFNHTMAEEYEKRYHKQFQVIMHCDEPERFRGVPPIRLQPPEVKSIVACGGYNQYRWPLLLDLDQACHKLSDDGIMTKATVLTSHIEEKAREPLKRCKFIDIKDDPGHDVLPSYLKGADALFIAEGFDTEFAKMIRYSVSTKAHLFMLAQRPIVVYGNAMTGVVAYAKQAGWANVVDQRSTDLLAAAMRELLTDDGYARRLVASADVVFERNHNSKFVRRQLLWLLSGGGSGLAPRTSMETR